MKIQTNKANEAPKVIYTGQAVITKSDIGVKLSENRSLNADKRIKVTQ